MIHDSKQSRNPVASDHAPLSPTTDALLRAFAERRDEKAFETLTIRFGSLVYGVALRVMGNHHDAEEVFQSTFLTLARHARTIACPRGLSVWLHRVAFHTALREKTRLKNRRQKEMDMVNMVQNTESDQKLWSDLKPVLDLELNNLPEKYRLPVLLCDIEGKSYHDAAAEIGCPPGTIASRLSHARELLASRLTRRGIVLTSALLTVLLTQNAASATVPAGLIASTATAATTVAVLPATVSGTAASKLIAGMTWVTETLGMGKALLVVVVVGASLLATGVTLRQPRQEPPKPQNRRVANALPAPVQLHGLMSEIVATYRKHEAAFQSLRLEYQQQTEYLQDPEQLFKKYLIFPNEYEIPPTMELLVEGKKLQIRGFDRGKTLNDRLRHLQLKYPNRFSLDNSRMKHDFTYQEWEKESANVPSQSHEQIFCFDGIRYYDNNHGAELGMPDSQIRPVRRIGDLNQISCFFFTPCPYFLNAVLAGSPNRNPGMIKTRGPDTRLRLLSVLEEGDCRVEAEHADLDGTDCVILELPQNVRVWLDRAHGFAIRRYTKNSVSRVDLLDLRQVSDDFYLPGKSVEIVPEYDSQKSNGDPQPIMKVTWTLQKLVINPPVTDDMFRLTPLRGSIVFDSTKQPLDEEGRAIDIGPIDDKLTEISYIQPESSNEIRAAIEKGRSTIGRRATVTPEVSSAVAPHAPPVILHTTFWFVLINVGILVAAVGFLLWRKLR